MRILIAPDKFKGTLTAQEAAEAIARGWKKGRLKAQLDGSSSSSFSSSSSSSILPSVRGRGRRRERGGDKVTLLPISDGGDGFGSVLGDALGAKPQRIATVDAAHRKCVSTWWWQSETRTAIIESANVIGLAMLPAGKFHPFQLDTFGLGKVLLAATSKGAKTIILGIGGSATNDGGFGLARALGWEFLDARGQRIEQWTQLHTLAEIRRPKSLFQNSVAADVSRLKQTRNWSGLTSAATTLNEPQQSLKLPKIIVAVDVKNPLLGKRGATRVYGPQKGLRADDFGSAEKNLRQLALIAKQQLGFDFARAHGAGAAGGLGYGLATFARGELRPGFELLAKSTRLASYLNDCDLVITGEGSLDASTLMGKGAGSLAMLCRARKIPVIGLAGVIQESPKLRKLFAHAVSLTQLTTTAQARERAAYWLSILAEQTARSQAMGNLASR